MNALELVGWLEDYASNSYCIEFEQAAIMLRTIPALQAEIEALKADNEQMCKALFKATRAILRKTQE